MRQKNIYEKCNFERTGHLVKFVSDALFGGSFAYMSHHLVGRSGNFRVCNCKVFCNKTTEEAQMGDFERPGFHKQKVRVENARLILSDVMEKQLPKKKSLLWVSFVLDKNLASLFQ